MDWSKTKTIFIITFLILDLFLAYQFVEKRNSSQFDIITETTIEEKFAADEISYGELPKDVLKETYISGKSKMFTNEELLALENQSITLIDSTILQGTFKQPVAIPETNTEYRLSQFLIDNIISGDSYTYWMTDEQTGTLIFFQKYKDRTLYWNYSAMLLVHLNENNQIVSYEQTLLEEIEEYDEQQEILPAIKALETLYEKNDLKYGSTITKIELGYYTLVQLTSSQVLAPTWHIVVDDKIDFFVNAFEGQIIRPEQKIME